MLLTNALALLAAAGLLAFAVRGFSSNPPALVFLPFLVLGEVVKAYEYDTGAMRKALDLYPYSLSSLNSVYALGDVALVLLFLIIWFYKSPTIPHVEYCERLREWALLVFVVYTIFFWEEATRNWGKTLAAAGDNLIYTPGRSFIVSFLPLWPLATAVLLVVARSRWMSAAILGIFGFTSVWSSSFGRSGLVSCLIGLMIIKVQSLRPRLAVGLVTLGVLAATIGALTRGTADVSSEKIFHQALGDVQSLDQTVSYFNHCSDDLVWPRAPEAFFESFYYGFSPRFVYRDKPGEYGNFQTQAELVPLTRISEKTLRQKGFAGGFFPISMWVEMFYEFGVPIGLLGFFGIAGIFRVILHRARTGMYAWVFTIMTISFTIGFFRGGSNWLMAIAKAFALFVVTEAPVTWLVRRRRRVVLPPPVPLASHRA